MRKIDSNKAEMNKVDNYIQTSNWNASSNTYSLSNYDSSNIKNESYNKGSYNSIKNLQRPCTAKVKVPKKSKMKSLKLSEIGANLRKIAKRVTNLGMIRESIDKESEVLNSNNWITFGIQGKPNWCSKRSSRPRSSRKASRGGRNFEGLYVQSTDRELKDEMNLLYQGGSPVHNFDFGDNFRALPMSIAKITFKHEVNTTKAKFNFKKNKKSLIPKVKLMNYDIPLTL